MIDKPKYKFSKLEWRAERLRRYHRDPDFILFQERCEDIARFRAARDSRDWLDVLVEMFTADQQWLGRKPGEPGKEVIAKKEKSERRPKRDWNHIKE